jgi:diketogulonate reductase-like aldo/keto reductase
METTITVPGGHRIPRLSFGTYQIAPRDTERLVTEALRAGYRHIDTARYYRNKVGVGPAVRACGFARGDIWITSKLLISADDADDVRRAIDATVDALGTHVDFCLIHNVPFLAGIAVMSNEHLDCRRPVVSVGAVVITDCPAESSDHGRSERAHTHA